MDARDATGCCAASVEAKSVEPGPYNISSRYTILDGESRALVRRHFPPETEIREGLDGNISPMSTAKAQAAFDYTPRYERFRSAALTELRVNSKYGIYNLFAKDPDGRRIEFQAFIESVPNLPAVPGSA